MSNSVIVPARSGRTATHVPRVAPDHLPGLLAHREDLPGAAVHRDDRGLVEDDALALPVDERVRGAEVDREIAAHLAAHHPVRVARDEGLLLPDRDVLLQALDPVAAGLEGVAAVRGAERRPRRSPPPRRGRRSGARSRPCGPAIARASRRRSRRVALDREVVPGLVAEPRHVAGARVVAHRADEDAGAARAGIRDERERLVDEDRLGRDPDERALAEAGLGRSRGHRSEGAVVRLTP